MSQKIKELQKEMKERANALLYYARMLSWTDTQREALILADLEVALAEEKLALAKEQAKRVHDQSDKLALKY